MPPSAANQAPVRMAIAGGGTGGHVLPALAVVDEFRQRRLPAEVVWIGSEAGVERDAAARAGIPFHSIQTGKLRRYFSLQTFTDAGRIPIGIAQARRILAAVRPDVVFSTGGFVSVPTVVAAKGVAPVLTHEQTAILGLATRIDARFAEVLAVSWEESAAAARTLHRRVVVTGNPVRASLRAGDAARGRAALGLSPELPVLYVTGGARGASPLNARVAALLPEILEHCQIIHQTGPASANDDLANLRAAQATWPTMLQCRYRAVEFVRDELADVYAASDLVLGRAGAGTVAELAFLGKPAILIPLPGAGGDEQARNAKILANVGAAELVRQDQATPDRLRDLIVTLLTDRSRLDRMARDALSVAKPDAAARLANVLLDLAMSNRT